ncbi:sensor histidine kinase [Parvularcula lutaonensis]|uniref:histidine kinase n=1 Tax=Parvularcula lutaonensis TaxID=491923 RepID=A0ABV7MD75_9PROT|nr:HAMP domain-containing sensor histidine kinase [Parvularcula lutaonensis]GGY39868.1 hypothetical protein GCM10007148_05400 [Parvularcula lutaonensis]
MDRRADIYHKAVRALRHDARNLLSGVAIMADHFEATGDAKGKQFARYLSDKINLMVRIAERADILADIEETSPSSHAPGALVRSVIEELPEGRDLVSVDVADDPLSCSPVLLELALREVLGNAVATGTPVSVRREGSELVVSDNGPGVSDLVREKLFEPFRGAKRPGGTSLGLPIALAAMKAQGGDISVESSADGTTVRLSFPG